MMFVMSYILNLMMVLTYASCPTIFLMQLCSLFMFMVVLVVAVVRLFPSALLYARAMFSMLLLIVSIL